MGAGLSTSGAKWDGQGLSGSGAKFARGFVRCVLGRLFLSRFRFPGPAASVASTPVCSFVRLFVRFCGVCLFARLSLLIALFAVARGLGSSSLSQRRYRTPRFSAKRERV